MYSVLSWDLSIRWKCNKSTSTKNFNSKIFNCCKQKLLHELHTPQNILCEQIISWAWNQKFGIHITLWSAVFPVRKSKRWPFHNIWCCSSPCFEVILAWSFYPNSLILALKSFVLPFSSVDTQHNSIIWPPAARIYCLEHCTNLFYV